MEDRGGRTHHVRAQEVDWLTEYSNYPESLLQNYRLKRLIGGEAPISQKDVSLVVTELNPRATYPSHSHPSPEIYYFLEGKVECTWEGETFVAEPGTAIYTPPNALHAMRNIGDEKAVMIVFWWGPHVNVLARLNEESS